MKFKNVEKKNNKNIIVSTIFKIGKIVIKDLKTKLKDLMNGK